MSFTTEVKHELSGLRPESPACDLAQLSALVRICGTLSYSGPGRFSIRAVTENGSVARALYLLPRKLFDIETLVTVRRSVLHKAHNYLIEMPEQPGLSEALVRMGVLDQTLRLASGIDPAFVSGDDRARAYLRGAFMASGFLTIILSTRLPASLTAMKVPPTTLALPGPVQAVVTPPWIAFLSPSSSGLMESIALIWGVMGSTISLKSAPSQAIASLSRPTWQCASTQPGVTR